MTADTQAQGDLAARKAAQVDARAILEEAGVYLGTPTIDRIVSVVAAALQGRAQEGEPSEWAELWYFVMDEAPTEFERIVTTFSPKVWHQEAHKLMRAKYPYRAALAQASRVEIGEAK